MKHFSYYKKLFLNLGVTIRSECTFYEKIEKKILYDEWYFNVTTTIFDLIISVLVELWYVFHLKTFYMLFGTVLGKK